MKRDTRNYPKLNFAMGGSVPSQKAKTYQEVERRLGERMDREWLQKNRDADIEDAGAGDPQDYELERNRSDLVVSEPERKPVFSKENHPSPPPPSGGYNLDDPDDRDAADENTDPA